MRPHHSAAAELEVQRLSYDTLFTMKSLIPVLLLVLLYGRAFGFAPFGRHEQQQQRSTGRQQRLTCSSLLMAAKRNKLSAKERRKRRAKQLAPLPVTGKPVDFNSKPAVVTTEEPIPKEETFADDAPPMQRAQQLLEAQRKSVDMLTYVRERVEALDYQEIQSSLSSSGYSVVDNFLDRSDVIDQLSHEGLTLFQNDDMEVDLTNLGSGEYICKIQGGEEQYKSCPRSVEFVVSTTKFMPPAFKGWNLDPSACMATMRLFNKKAQQASLELLSGELPVRPLSIVATEEKDARKISVLYYPSDGGGITLENGETIRGKRDRLILLTSDSCVHRKEPWNGEEDAATCIELHLVQG